MNKTNHIRLTQKIINSRLEHRNIKMVGEYYNSKTKILFQCANDHQWMAKANNVLNGTNCSVCVNKTLTKDIINERLMLKEIEMISEYKGALSSATFRCKKKHEWVTQSSSVVNMNHGCPRCAKSGFDKSKPAYAYILKFDDFIKYGITNDLNRRMIAHKINGNYDIVTSRLFEKGAYAHEWEVNVKKMLGGNYCTRDQFDNGYTETLSLNFLNNLIDMLNNFTYDK